MCLLRKVFSIFLLSTLCALPFTSNALTYEIDPRVFEVLSKGAIALPDLELPTQANELGVFSDLHNGLFKPEGGGAAPFPALVLAHTCGGIRPAEMQYWVKAALKEGYVVLVLDSMRGNKTNCFPPNPIPTGRRIKDLYDAGTHLSKIPIVDAKRMAVVGFSQGAFNAATLASPKVKTLIAPQAPRFAATAGLCGTCQFPAGTLKGVDWPFVYLFPDSDRPLLYLMAEKDNETPSIYCDEILADLKNKGAPVETYKYPDVTHCWDCATMNGFSKIDFRGEHIIYRYDADVTEDSRRRVFEFLAHHLRH